VTETEAGAAKSRRLRTHLVILVAVTLLPAITVGGVAVLSAVQSYRDAFEERLHDTARALASALDAEVGAHVAALDALATARSLDDGRDLADFHDRARRVAELLGSHVSLTTPPPDIRVVLHTLYASGTPIPAEVAEQPRRAGSSARRVFEEGRPVVGDLVRALATGRWVAPVQVPVVRDGHVAYALGVGLEAGRIGRLLRAQGSGGGGYTTLVDGAGTIVARSADAEDYVGRPVTEWLAAQTRASGEAGLLRGANRAGVQTVVAFRRLSAAPGWSVLVVEPLASYRAGLWRPLTALVLGGALALGLAIAAAAHIGRRLLRPVEALTQQAEGVVAANGAAFAAAPPLSPPQGGSPPEHSRPLLSGVAEFDRLGAAVLRAQRALGERAGRIAEAEARLRAVVETAVDAIIVIDEQGLVQSFNKSAEAIFGYAAEEVVGRNVRVLMPEHHAAAHDGYLARYRETGEKRIIGIGREVEGRRQDGTAVPLDLSIAEWRDAQGRRFFTGIMRDITLRKEVEARQRILMREVDHRAKNTLAVVQSLVRLTPAEDPAAYARAVEARVAALARAHTILAERGWTGADLRTLAAEELAPFAGRVTFEGPAVPLANIAAQPIGMVLHELATNATKHGALSAAAGRVALRWGTEGGALTITWTETGGPPLRGQPTHRGFGTRVIEVSIRQQLGGTVDRHWRTEGLVCEIGVPLARAVAGPDARPLACV
jgi:PAS domain S-box-containing protein